MNNKICINKKILIIICFFICFLSIFSIVETIITNKTVYNSEAAPIKKKVSNKPTAIYGGIEVNDPKRWPFMVRIYDDSDGNTYVSRYGSCDGTLIAPRWVLTSAHCGISPSIGSIFIGSNNLKDNFTSYKIEKFISHSDFRCTDSKCEHDINDIALIKLKNPVINAQTISLNLTPTFRTEAEGVLEVLLGWGRSDGYTKTDILKQAVVPILSNNRANKLDWYNGSVLPSMIASGFPLGGAGTCLGDSGGPGIVWDGVKWVQVGIISWTQMDMRLGNRQICALPKKPSVATRLSFSGIILKQSVNYFQWIKNTIMSETGELYLGIGSFKGADLPYSEKSDFIRRIWINKELETDSGQP